jgi:outer membrane protein TolC
MKRAFTIVVLLGAIPLPAVAQQRTLELGELQQAAIANDPRTRQVALLEMQTTLRLRNIAALRLPVLNLEAQAQYQTDVPQAPFQVGGQSIFAAPKKTYDSYLRAEQRLFDPTIGAQAALERAQLAEQQSRVRSAIFAVRQQVNEAFFAAALLDSRAAVVATTIEELQQRLKEMQARVAGGSALPADAAAIEATLLQRQQDRDEVQANRHAALARLSTIVGRPIADDEGVVLPNLPPGVALARQSPATLRTRPEFEQFARTRERLSRQQAVSNAGAAPRISAFARLGYGRPGLNFLRDEFDSYALGGIRFQWNVWNWGSTGREAQALAIQAQIVAADEAAFSRGILESIENDAAAVDRLQRALATDERIVALREQVQRTTNIRMGEGLVTVADYLATETQTMQAMLARGSHEIELAQAGARVLTTLGLEVR